MAKKINAEMEKHIKAGCEAAKKGLPRTPPTSDPEATRLWLKGYDLVKRFEEMEVLRGLTGVVQ